MKTSIYPKGNVASLWRAGLWVVFQLLSSMSFTN